MSHPCDTSKNGTKLEWWNNSDGIKRRNLGGAHIPISYPQVLLDLSQVTLSTTAANMTQSALFLHAFTSYNTVGGTECPKTCRKSFALMAIEVKADVCWTKSHLPSQKAAALMKEKELCVQ